MTTTAEREDLADITTAEHADTLIWDGRTVEAGVVLAGIPRATAEMLEHLGHGRVYRG